MRSPSRAHLFAVLAALLGISALVGLLITRLEVDWLFAIVLGGIGLALVFVDYRFGAACLTVMFPWVWSPFVPQTSGFSLINFLVFTSLASLFLRRAPGREQTVWLPSETVWFYLLPIALAAFIAWPNLHIGELNFPAVNGTPESLYAPVVFLKSRIFKPMFFVMYAFVLANAVRDSEKPERFLIAFGLSALIPALAIINEVVGGGDVYDRDHFLSGLGLQVNEYGTLLALAAGPLLFICVGGGPRRARVAAGALFTIVSAALLMTASRGAAVSYAVILAVWLLRRRKFTDLLVVLAAIAILAAVLPDATLDRLTMGFDDIDTAAVNNGRLDDPLTKGRVGMWEILAPDFLKNPFFGGGLSSIGWNSAVTAGRIYIGHPHNLYLLIALDLGLVGGVAVLYVFYRYARAMFRLSRESSLSPLLRDYFMGAFAAYLGMLVAAVTGGDYLPHPEQTFFWFSLGFTFAYWKRVQGKTDESADKPFGLGVRAAKYLRPNSNPRR